MQCKNEAMEEGACIQFLVLFNCIVHIDSDHYFHPEGF